MKSRETTVTYEVNLTIQVEVAQAFKQWLLPHVEEMLQIKGFSDVALYRVLDPVEPAYEQIVVLYTVDSMEDLAHYLQHDAARMRQKTQDLFGNQFSVSRRIYKNFVSPQHVILKTA